MKTESKSDSINRLIEFVLRLRDEGGLFGGRESEIASLAYRRGHSFDRRHKNLKNSTFDDRVLDLFKGLSPRKDPDWLHTHPAEIQCLAEQLAEILKS